MGRIAFGVVLAAAIVFSLWRLAQHPVVGNPSAARSEALPTPGAERASEAAPRSPSATEAPERGLARESSAGAEAEGALRVDAEGRFVPGPETVEFFDFFLSATGKESSDDARLRVSREVERRLPVTARADVVALYDEYVRYHTRVAAIERKLPDPADMERRYELVRELRREVFGPSLTHALFHEQERMEEVAVERRRVMNDPTLNDRQRIQRLAEMQARLPEQVRRAEAEAYSSFRLAREDDELAGGGGSEAEIQALREQRVGAEAAERMAKVDRDRASWAERMTIYREERDRVMAGTTNAPEEAKAALLRRVRERHFTPEETPRVEALDRIELRERSLGRAPILLD